MAPARNERGHQAVHVPTLYTPCGAIITPRKYAEVFVCKRKGEWKNNLAAQGRSVYAGHVRLSGGNSSKAIFQSVSSLHLSWFFETFPNLALGMDWDAIATVRSAPIA